MNSQPMLLQNASRPQFFKPSSHPGFLVENGRFVCLYVDNSNIFIEGQRVARRDHGEDSKAFRIYFRNLIHLAVANRSLREAVWGGSIPPDKAGVWERLRNLGVNPDLLPRAGGENETVDHLIQLRMHRHARKFRGNPGTIVLATGDGRGYDQEEGFLYDAEQLVAEGWALELLSWEHSCSQKLRKFAEAHGKFISLNAYYDSISFITGGRIVSPIARLKLP